MNTKQLLIALSVLLLVVPAATSGEGDPWSGELLAGFRAVSIDGVENKYQQHINLESGPRLFGFRFDYQPVEGDLRNLVDEVHIDISNFGGDPYEAMNIGFRKFGAYDFKYTRRESIYFYNDIILPKTDPSASIDAANAGDFHTFDVKRVQDTATLTVDLNDRAKLMFGFNRFTRRGESTTTYDVSRDEFEFDQPVHESHNEYVGGFQYSWDNVTLSLEERIRDYESDISIFLPGFSLGENENTDPLADDVTSLNFFFLDRPYSYTSYQHTARATITPTDRIILRVSASLQDLELDLDYSERSDGTTFDNLPLAADISGVGQIDRDISVYDADLSYKLTDDVALLFGARLQELEQDGGIAFAGVNEDGEGLDGLRFGMWDFDTTSFDAGVQWQATTALALTLGVLQEERDFSLATGFEELSDANGDGTLDDELDTEAEPDTEHTGVFLDVGWRPSSALRLNFGYENSSYDDPFTLASPTDRDRYDLGVRYNAESGFWVAGSYNFSDYENGNSGWASDWTQIRVDAGYNTEQLAVSGGYSVIATERKIDQQVAPGFIGPTFLFPVFYEADIDQITGAVRWRFDDEWSVGGNGLLYQSDGSWEQDYSDLRGYVQYDFTRGYLVRVGYRTVSYEEPVRGFNDYDADIGEVSFGYRF